MKNGKQRRNDKMDKARKGDERPDDRASAREMQYRYGVSDKAYRKVLLCADSAIAVRHAGRFARTV